VSQPLHDQGRIPFTLRLGVTGHRDLPDSPEIRRRVKEAIDRAIGLLRTPSDLGDRVRRWRWRPERTSVRILGVTMLADGADRIVAELVLARAEGTGVSAPLVVPLPRSEREYAKDFDETSRGEFHRLMRRARALPPPGSRTHDEGYAIAGMRLVESCDVLIAIWDKQRKRGTGGTAEIVRYALEQRVPVVLVPASGAAEIVVDDGTGAIPPAFDNADAVRGDQPPAGRTRFQAKREKFALLERYNRRAFREGEFEGHIEKERLHLPAEDSQVGRTLPVNDLANWILPNFARADLNAVKSQRWHYVFVWAQFLGAAAAVLAIAVQTVLTPKHPGVGWIEVSFLALLLLIVGVGRPLFEFHERWVSSRYLAERFRSDFYLAAVGLRRRERDVEEAFTLAEPPDEWLDDAYEHVWNTRPPVELSESDAPRLRELIVDSWLRGQIAYHDQTSRRHGSALWRYTAATVALFAITFSFAFVHSLGVGEETKLADVWILVAIGLPAIGGAIAGVAEHQQHRRHAEVYHSMRRLLTTIVDRLAKPERPTLAQVRAAAAQAAEAMAGENIDWFGVMKLYDVEWHV
jgi:hypothetical protein